jgi:hypothetical protein
VEFEADEEDAAEGVGERYGEEILDKSGPSSPLKLTVAGTDVVDMVAGTGDDSTTVVAMARGRVG